MKPAATVTDPADQAALALIEMVKAHPVTSGYAALLVLFILAVAMTLAPRVTLRK